MQHKGICVILDPESMLPLETLCAFLFWKLGEAVRLSFVGGGNRKQAEATQY